MNKDDKARFSGLIKFIPVKDKLFWLLLVVFIGIPLSYFGYDPIWDGWQFSLCYTTAAAKESLSLSLYCHAHSAFLHTFIFSLTQRIDLGNFWLIYTLNLLFGIAGLISLRLLLAYIFGGRLSRTNLTLLTFCFGLNPVFLVHVIQPSLDYTLPILLVMVLLFLFKNRFLYAAAAGTLLVFTKESGFMLYGVSVFLFIPLMIFNDPSVLGEKVKLLMRTIVLIIPVLLFGIYMIFVPYTQIGNTWTDGIMKMFQFNTWSGVILAQFISLFIINFNWIISLIILINVAVIGVVGIRALTSKAVLLTPNYNRYEGLYFAVLFLAILYFLTRIPFVNNPRYMLPALPVMIILFGGSLITVLRKQPLITITLTIVLALFTVSSFRTVDPVSKKIMGTFKFGSHEMLQMSRFEDLKYGYGRDQLVYNFEFTQFHYVTEKIFRKIGWGKNIAIAPEFTWLSYFGAFDIGSGHQSIDGEKVRSLTFIYSDEITDENNAPHEIYFISYPNYDRDNVNANERARLSAIYDLEEIITVENDGYSVDVYHYVKKSE